MYFPPLVLDESNPSYYVRSHSVTHKMAGMERNNPFSLFFFSSFFPSPGKQDINIKKGQNIDNDVDSMNETPNSILIIQSIHCMPPGKIKLGNIAEVLIIL